MNSHNQRLKQMYPDCWQWIRLARRFPGQLTDDESNALFQLARARTPSSHPAIVELGACQGKTTLLLSAGLRGKSGPRLFSFRQIGSDDSSAFQRVLRRCGLERIAHVMLAHPQDAGASWNDGIDMLFVNAQEEDDSLQSHLTLWSPFVRQGGVVALYGISEQSAEPFLSAPACGDFRRVDNLQWAVKHSAEIDPRGDAVEDAMATLQDYVRRSAKEYAESRHALQALQQSWSWRLTAPLRWGIEMFQALVGTLTSFGHGSAGARIDGLGQWLRFGRQVRASGLLDERYYRDSHPGVAWARTSPVLHFFVCGAMAGDKPNPLFDLDYYLGRYPDVAHSGMNPLVHYLKQGAYEGNDPHPHFDSSFYLDQNPDVREAQLNPLAHYLAPGIAEGRDPNPWFDTSEYLEQNPDVAAFGLNPLWHQAEMSRQAEAGPKS